ncbi:uncharacterized protein LOC115623824 [Scaptodrosophila lebanonensis]|uniref:carboxylesterase n=1 Tax=Drosophila lebanonensis TaxID=7225 RepID=A0A6J2TGJ1_DROLE|nr:uncharacterized protein LOC115623824 [Scaptodrosophila lebanonensis]
MDVQVGVGDLLKLGAKLIAHKVIQYRLGTKHTTELATKYGRVKGLQRKTIYDGELYFAFEGIPFAKPPLGELRFRAPQPVEPWQGVRDCTFPRGKPLQKHFVLKVMEGSEDCLYLNVYAKKLKEGSSTTPLPVIVWIYGGGFQIGEATRDFYSPDYFMKHDVVLVTFNYRLGVLGFLSLKDRDLDVPGNAGLKDQVQALRWIHENIAEFNGDPNNITLMGESAGAASTEVMMTTEQTRGLFHKAIMQSGSSLCSWANEPDRSWPYRLACRLGYAGSENEKEVFRFLLKASPNDITSQCNNVLTKEEVRDYLMFPFGPVVEPYVSEHCVIPKPQSEQLATAWGNELPLIIGGTSFEGLFSYQSTMHDAEHMLSSFEAILPRSVREQSTPAEIRELVRQLKIFYFEDATRGSMEFNECLQVLSIKHFWHDMHRTLLARLPNSKFPTYLYRFDFDSPHFNHYRILLCGRHQRGVSHADDISYMFYHILSSKIDKTSPEYRTIERLIAMWTSFAAHGNPNCEAIAPTSWNALEADGPRRCLNISERVEFITLPETKQFELWDSFYTKQDPQLFKIKNKTTTINNKNKRHKCCTTATALDKSAKVSNSLLITRLNVSMESDGAPIEAKTSSGPIIGKGCKAVYGDEYVSFERIPYAEPPIGELRFKAPQPVKPWTEPLDCRYKGEKPLQYNHFTQQLEGREDCLYLNVYAKKLNSSHPLPLIVFFFGGGFEKGDPTTELHSPDYFMMRDVVVATVSYRVGALGFLSLKDAKVGVPGNAGLKDQFLALQWLKLNASNFNADPSNITVFGESAGAASVHYLMLNPRAEGLFHKAILQSGNVLCSWALCPLTNLPQRLAIALGMDEVEAATDAKLLEFLQRVPGEQLVKPYLLSASENLDDCLFQFGPMVEPYACEHSVLLQPPSELLANAWGNKIPVLMSGTSFEGLLMYARVHLAPYLITTLKEEPEHMLPLDLKRNLPLDVARRLGLLLQRTHFGEKPIGMDSVLSYCEYASYKVFWHPIIRGLNKRLAVSQAPTYLYRFDFDSPTFNHQRLKYCGDKLRGVAHVDDHSYLWYGAFSWKLDRHTPEFLTITRMIDIVTTFAATSNPNCPSVASELSRSLKWAPLRKDAPTIECLNISDHIKLMDLPEQQKLLVWDSIYKK